MEGGEDGWDRTGIPVWAPPDGRSANTKQWSQWEAGSGPAPQPPQENSFLSSVAIERSGSSLPVGPWTGGVTPFQPLDSRREQLAGPQDQRRVKDIIGTEQTPPAAAAFLPFLSSSLSESWDFLFSTSQLFLLCGWDQPHVTWFSFYLRARGENFLGLVSRSWSVQERLDTAKSVFHINSMYSVKILEKLESNPAFIAFLLRDLWWVSNSPNPIAAYASSTGALSTLHSNCMDTSFGFSVRLNTSWEKCCVYSK